MRSANAARVAQTRSRLAQKRWIVPAYGAPKPVERLLIGTPR
jgi:hypothetical protein